MLIPVRAPVYEQVINLYGETQHQKQHRGDYWPLYLGFYVHEYWQKHSVHVTGRADTEKSTFTESQSDSLTE